MARNPYPTTDLGKTMGDVRLKICKEVDLAEPELIEMVVAGQLIGVECLVSLVYEQVWWPFIFRRNNPDEEVVPPIEEMKPSDLVAMDLTYRLAGIDGEAQEDRVENLVDPEQNMVQQDYEEQYACARVLGSKKEGKKSGLEIILYILDTKITSIQSQSQLCHQILTLLSLALKLEANKRAIASSKGSVSVLTKKLFEAVHLPAFDELVNIMDSFLVQMTD